MLSLPAIIEPMFIAAGWRHGDALVTFKQDTTSADEHASQILRQFGGLHVGEIGPGTEVSASDVRFYADPRPEVSIAAQPWKRHVGKVVAFATAHHDHMILFVSEKATYYVFTDPDERLYSAGASFGDLMQRLLYGYQLGALVERDA